MVVFVEYFVCYVWRLEFCCVVFGGSNDWRVIVFGCWGGDWY